MALCDAARLAHHSEPGEGDSRGVSVLIRAGIIHFCYTAATTSISTNAPLGRVFTATADRAGYGFAKNSA